MVPGINTAVRRDGVEYQVQTEDLGTKNPIILTLAYRDGAVVLRETLDYGQTLAANPPPALIRALMDAQHHRIARHISDGELEPKTRGPERPAALPRKSVDDLIEEYLRARRGGQAGRPVRRTP